MSEVFEDVKESAGHQPPQGINKLREGKEMETCIEALSLGRKDGGQ